MGPHRPMGPIVPDAHFAGVEHVSPRRPGAGTSESPCWKVQVDIPAGVQNRPKSTTSANNTILFVRKRRTLAGKTTFFPKQRESFGIPVPSPAPRPAPHGGPGPQRAQESPRAPRGAMGPLGPIVSYARLAGEVRFPAARCPNMQHLPQGRSTSINRASTTTGRL